MNGVPMEEKHLTEEDFEEQLLTLLMKETQAIQRAVYKNQLTDQQVKIIALIFYWLGKCSPLPCPSVDILTYFEFNYVYPPDLTEKCFKQDI